MFVGTEFLVLAILSTRTVGLGNRNHPTSIPPNRPCSTWRDMNGTRHLWQPGFENALSLAAANPLGQGSRRFPWPDG